MEIKLVDEHFEKQEYKHNQSEYLQYAYLFYKKSLDYLTKLLDKNISNENFFEIVNRLYDVELFGDVHDTIKDCWKLNIKYKRLNTNFILYEKGIGAPKFYFEDWIIMETGKVDTRRIYNGDEIQKLLETNQMIPLSTFGYRPSSKRLSHVQNDHGSYDLLYNNEFVIDEADLTNTYGEIETITHYKNWLIADSMIYDNPIILQKLRDHVFTKERITNDINYFRFRALEVLKIMKNKCYMNDRFRDAIECEKALLIRKLD